MQIKFLAAGLALGLSVLSSTAADAQLQFCNRTNVTLDITVGYPVNNHWFVSGWYTAQPRECITPRVVNGPLRNRHYFFHASQRHGNGLVFAGEHRACVSSRRFDAPWTTNCRSGERTEGFRRIDTGATALRYTVNLNGTAAAPPAPVFGPVQLSGSRSFNTGTVRLDGALDSHGRLSYSGTVEASALTAALRAQVRFRLLDGSGRVLHTTGEQRLPTAAGKWDPIHPSTARVSSHVNVPANVARQTRRVEVIISGR